MNSIWQYIRYSGVSIIFALNPLYWKVLPWFRKEDSEWQSDNTYSFTFLFLTIRIWIDNGEW